MAGWEHEASAMLRSLGDSDQQGRISRATYRERRRRVLAALRQRHEVTERNPITSTGMARPAPGRCCERARRRRVRRCRGVG